VLVMINTADIATQMVNVAFFTGVADLQEKLVILVVLIIKIVADDTEEAPVVVFASWTVLAHSSQWRLVPPIVLRTVRAILTDEMKRRSAKPVMVPAGWSVSTDKLVLSLEGCVIDFGVPPTVVALHIPSDALVVAADIVPLISMAVRITLLDLR